MIKARWASIQGYVSSTLDPMSEGALAAAPMAASGASKDRLEREISENYEFLWRSLRRLGIADGSVEDAVQQVLVVFARRIDDIHLGAERSFLFATATRVAADFRKMQNRRREVLDTDALDNHASSTPSVEQLIDQGRAREIFDWVLGEIPIELRTVFILFELESMTMANIADMLDLRPGTVASRLRRARAMFESKATRLQRNWRPQ